jgi:tetratricopeptide (TPR) repeat protein
MDLDQKIELFSKRLTAAPHSRVFAPLADLLRQARRWEDALELLDDGLGRHPDYVSALVIKGRTLLDAGRMDEARTILARVLEVDSENLVVLRLLTEDARSRQDWAGSLPLLEKLAVLDPEDKRWAEALNEARRFAEQVTPSETGDASFATMTLVDIYLAQGYRDKAVAALRRMAAREPNREDVRERLHAIVSDSAGPLPSPPGANGPAADTARTPDGSTPRARRQDEKKKFAEWIDRIKQEGGPAS